MLTMGSHEADRRAISKDLEKQETIFHPRGLNIVWGDDSRYWTLPNQEQRDMTAKLLRVNWFEVSGSIELDSNKKYQIGFKISLNPDAFGWKDFPVFIMAKWGKRGKHSVRKVYLSACEEREIPENFVVDIPDAQLLLHDEQRLYIGLFEIWSGKWKGGLLLHHAFVREAN